jgi:pimeloyl-ACP methyl ester carboxylesterase
MLAANPPAVMLIANFFKYGCILDSVRGCTMIRIRSFVVVLLLAGCLSSTVFAQEHSEIPYDSVQVNGITMWYHDVGEGPPLVLLHGLTGTSALWDPFLEELSSKYRLIVPDLRGHGRTLNPSGHFLHRELALDVFALLDELHIDHFSAVGASMGAMTLIHAGTMQPNRLDAIVLVGGSPYLPEEARVIYRTVSPDSIPPENLAVMAQAHSDGVDQLSMLLRQFRAYKDSYDDVNFTPPYLSTIKASTLIVHGDRDQFFPVSLAMEMYQSIPNSYLWVVPNGRHMAPFGTARGRETFVDTILEFLEGKWTPSLDH